MELSQPSFGHVEIDGEDFDHDVVIEAGAVRPREKRASKAHKARYGHTPLSVDEDLPWSLPQLVVGTGAEGRLPIMPEVWEEAERHGVELIAVPTEEACELLADVPEAQVAAVLHVTC